MTEKYLCPFCGEVEVDGSDEDYTFTVCQECSDNSINKICSKFKNHRGVYWRGQLDAYRICLSMLKDHEELGLSKPKGPLTVAWLEKMIKNTEETVKAERKESTSDKS